MKINGQPTRTIRPAADGVAVEIIDQTFLPHSLTWARLETLENTVVAIKDMKVRGAPLIGATAAYGVALALASDVSDDRIEVTCKTLLATRPTAVNLRWAIDEMHRLLLPLPVGERRSAAWKRAAEICDEDVALNSAIGDHAFAIIKALWEKQRAARAQRLNLLTHCNAGWLASVDWGTATARRSTRRTTPAFRCMSGSTKRDRATRAPRSPRVNSAGTACRTRWSQTTRAGTSCSTAWSTCASSAPIARRRPATSPTRLALTSRRWPPSDNSVPFYVALPGPTIDWTIADGLREIPIEERSANEVTFIFGAVG